MMNCADYRRSMLTDPHDPDAALSEHRGSCRECSQYTERLLGFESRLDRALRAALPAPDQRASGPAPADRVVPLRRPVGRNRWLAMAASLLLACVVAGALWLSIPDRSLAADVVKHVQGEPKSWLRTDVPVPGSELEDVLRNSHMRLAANSGIVSYAASCGFRGYHVPHLVVQTQSGPVTVMVLVHEHVSKPTEFDEQGYRGVIVPVAGHGTLAVLTQGGATDLSTIEHIAARVQGSIVWTG
jgi:Protein of unknown function (DUF3379)